MVWSLVLAWSQELGHHVSTGGVFHCITSVSQFAFGEGAAIVLCCAGVLQRN